ncbi:protoporphyrinogen oxidase [Kurthia sibirica]|uniref:Coproporphyrinogen III oxidase n=1 Tax=Kurthia sibirica TaxID=202750 RepID=A0A2U3AJ62_9BACL|nr:protoporphyrinogen oxidase [Kurthia sibirica]PWI24573.1 protoporphyrinogen oxidase [Kurthia sibirica]GEK33526.1 protoporphyrinogen oxidase [Kurthia sibirica]
MKTVAVVGGGITGMSTMHYLQRQITAQQLPIQLVLIEKDATLGGKMVTKKQGDFIMEVGADSIVARHKSVMPLIEELNLQEQIVYNDTGKSYILTNNELHAIPTNSVFGIPMDEAAIEASTLVSAAGKEQIYRDLTIPNDRFTKEDSIGDFLAYFLGDEIVEKQIAPVLSGVYSGDLYKLTIASTLPNLLEYKNKYGSMIRGFEAHKELYDKTASKKFISFEHGLVQLFDRMESVLTEAIIYKNTAVQSLEKKDNFYQVNLTNGAQIEADYVVLATPHQVAEKLLPHPALQQEFNKLQTASIITVYLGYEMDDAVLPANGTGFIVSTHNDVDCNACTWTSRKWHHTSPSGKLLIRMFYKKNNARFAEFSAMTEAELTAVAREDVRKSLHIEEEPNTVTISKWMDLMPVYNLEHPQAVKGLEQKLRQNYPRVALAGSSYYGVGIGLCIQNGHDLATAIIEELQE